MSRTWVALCAAGAGVAGARTAVARDAQADCAPEDWFCDDEKPAPPELAPPPELPSSAEAAPPNEPPPATPPPPGMLPEKMDLSPAVSERGMAENEDELLSRWSVNLRLQGVALGAGGHRDSGLGGLGISLRYALSEGVALDLGLDSFGGTDYNGYDHNETSLSMSALLYLNPRRVLRTYLLAGLNASAARVEVAGDDQNWAYVGAQAGLGLDFVANDRVSLNLDLLGFVRGRTDSRAAREPEFTDSTGNVTNTSGGALFRGGISFYW